MKSNLLELKAVYGGARRSAYLPPEGGLSPVTKNDPTDFAVDEKGNLTRLGGLEFASPLTVQILRAYLDNDMFDKKKWEPYETVRQEIRQVKREGDAIFYDGRLVKNCIRPVLKYSLVLRPFDGGIDLEFVYEVAEFIDFLPRIGLTFALDKKNLPFSYTGYGPNESYIDKRLASAYGTYQSTAEENYGRYIRPQESGSHFGTTELKVGGLTVTAEKPFSFSVLPYGTETLIKTAHDFELPQSQRTYVNLDVAMSGVGTHSCGPELAREYRAPKKGRNIFRIRLDR